MIRKLVATLGVCVYLLFSSQAKAICNSYTHVVADGTLVAVTVPPSGSVAAFFNQTAGHSYSVEVRDPADTGDVTNFFVGGAGTTCPASNVAGFTSTVNVDPWGTSPGAFFRGSFTATTSGTYHVIRLDNSSGSVTLNLLVSVSDTTQYNPRWSTYGGYSTQWGFNNTTNTAISGTLKVYTNAGALVSNTTFSIDPGLVAFKSTSGLAIAASQAGNAIFTHNGPPGAIQADCYMISSDGKTIVPTKFQPVRETVH
jgi:hypothetical protein